LKIPIVLIVDDDNFYRKIFSEIFGEKGVRTFTAADGNEGYASYRKVAPDLVLLDRIMPDSGGTRFLMDVQNQGNRKQAILMIYSRTLQEKGSDFRKGDQVPEGFSEMYYVSKSTPPEVLVKRAMTLLKSDGSNDTE